MKAPRAAQLQEAASRCPQYPRHRGPQSRAGTPWAQTPGVTVGEPETSHCPFRVGF